MPLTETRAFMKRTTQLDVSKITQKASFNFTQEFGSVLLTVLRLVSAIWLCWEVTLLVTKRSVVWNLAKI